MTQPERITPEEWFAAVREVLAQQPELAAVTVQAMQEGILAANDRLRARIADVSMGLAEAMRTKLPHRRRNHDLIVKAIKASTVHPSIWSKEAIRKERAAQATKRSVGKEQ